MPTATSKTPNYSEVLDAIRQVSTESDLWRLSETVLRTVPIGTRGLQEIVDKASTEGILGKLSVNTLRAYRTTAETWPEGKRIKGASFSAHREAERLNGGLESKRQLLTQVAKANGGKITVDAVRASVRAKQGKKAQARPPRAGAAPKPGTPPTTDELVTRAIADLKAGGPFMLPVIRKMDGKELDALHAGTSKVLGEIEQLRMKAARKAKQAKQPAPASTPTAKKVQPSNGAAKKAAPANGNGAKPRAGNLRGL